MGTFTATPSQEFKLSNDTVLATAEFNRKVRTYWLLLGSTICVVTVAGVLLLPVWLLAGHYFTERYLQHLSCVLTTRSLKVGRGMFVRQEKTVPLDKITDVALVEGPLMRYLDLQAVKIETAGGSAGAFVQLVGIVDAREFRDIVLRQRDHVVAGDTEPSQDEGPSAVRGDQAVLTEIRDALLRIEERLPRG